MNNRIYSMEELTLETKALNGDVFIICYTGEERSKYGYDILINNRSKFDRILLLYYDDKRIAGEIDGIEADNLEKVCISNEQFTFIESLKRCRSLNSIKNIIIDISSMKTIDIFLMLKFLYMKEQPINVNVINTIPYDYYFMEKPFTSYKSYKGDLEIHEVVGYSGTGKFGRNLDLYIFLGFEGTLSKKVVEEVGYHKLFLVNTMPSYYQKYKDISVINNNSLISSKSQKLMYAPADNPFEVYNLLDRSIADRNVCIAPLSTKPISLGICLYALNHDNVRIVYPTSNIYRNQTSFNVHKSYLYKICFQQERQ